MKTFVLALAVLAILPLTACRTTIKSDDVEVQTSTSGGGHGTFCPPGQAKKNNC